MVFVVIDALRPANLGCYGYDLPTSPVMDSLAGEGAVFENAYCCTNLTDSSFTSMLSGRYPPSHAIVHHGFDVTDEEIAEFEKTDAEYVSQILHENGFKTLAADYLGRWHLRGWDVYQEVVKEKKSRGFLKFLKPVGRLLSKLPRGLYGGLQKTYRSVGLGEPTLPGRQLTDAALQMMDSREGKPFFLMLHYMDAHSPFNTFPASLAQEFYRADSREGETVEELTSRIKNPKWRKAVERVHFEGLDYVNEIYPWYDAGIRYCDGQVGRVLEYLEKEGLRGETIVAVTADHGSQLMRGSEYYSHQGLYQPVVKVPLVLNGPGVKKARLKQLVQHVDLTPAFLELAGLDSSGHGFEGVSLLRCLEGETIREAAFVTDAASVERYAVVKGEHKLICSLGEVDSKFDVGYSAREELYNLAKDPREENNLVDSDEDKKDELKKELMGWLARSRTARESSWGGDEIKGL